MPVSSKWEYGKNAYRDLILCIEKAIDDDEPDVAVVCAFGLSHLAQAEKASYWGYEDVYGYNTAMNEVKKAIEFAKKEGVPSYLRKELEELEMDYEYITGEKP